MFLPASPAKLTKGDLYVSPKAECLMRVRRVHIERGIVIVSPIIEMEVERDGKISETRRGTRSIREIYTDRDCLSIHVRSTEEHES